MVRKVRSDRRWKTIEEKIALKAAYDRDYRKKNAVRIKADHAAYFQRTYDPVKAAIERKKKMPVHVEYCRQPIYRAYKQGYDRQRRASVYGPFAEAYHVLLLLRAEIRRQMPNRFERYQQAGTHQWNPLTYAKKNQRRQHRGIPTTDIDCR